MSRRKQIIMNWSNLQLNRCPKCSSDLQEGSLNTDFLVCKSVQCDFKISKGKFRKLTDDFDRDGAKKSKEFEGYGFE
jgi:hypothetical protein